MHNDVRIKKDNKEGLTRKKDNRYKCKDQYSTRMVMCSKIVFIVFDVSDEGNCNGLQEEEKPIRKQGDRLVEIELSNESPKHEKKCILKNQVEMKLSDDFYTHK